MHFFCKPNHNHAFSLATIAYCYVFFFSSSSFPNYFFVPLHSFTSTFTRSKIAQKPFFTFLVLYITPWTLCLRSHLLHIDPKPATDQCYVRMSASILTKLHILFDQTPCSSSHLLHIHPDAVEDVLDPDDGVLEDGGVGGVGGPPRAELHVQHGAEAVGEQDVPAIT